MRRHLRRTWNEPDEEHFLLSLGDLLSSLVGVIMLLVIYVLVLTPFSMITIEPDERPLTQRLAELMSSVVSEDGYAEMIFVESDHILLPMLNDKQIAAEDVATDEELKAYLRRLYTTTYNEGQSGVALLMVGNDAYATSEELTDLLYELGRDDERYLSFQQLFVHENLLFVNDEAYREELRERWGSEE